jgi:hypothetical protein
MLPSTSFPTDAVENVSSHLGPMGFWIFIYPIEIVLLKLDLHAAYEDKL